MHSRYIFLLVTVAVGAASIKEFSYVTYESLHASEAHEVAGGSGRVKRSHDSNIINRSKARCPRFESCVVEELHSTIPY
ncbi:hypothetical protein DSO57_1008382 [Entomophthora muscae]|uniref:Uncharacterized protein n=1 Tax=Entomophthora muscae TaxID=34485 RepID=A0ACC2RY71_9FUNG|nr:hypothetical protein DSO57_1008382 [Entomophthora muscae]